MKIITKTLSFLLCVIICFSLITTVSATTSTTNPTITVTNVDAKVGDTVNIDLEISNNPGIMAMAFCITYDSQVLEFVEDTCKTNSSYTTAALTYKNHADKGHVSVVLVENKADNSKNGKILSLSFVVKKDVAGNHTITLANSNREKHGNKLHNSFSNSKQDYIIPKIISGGVTVPQTCENSGHNYGEWNITKQPNCTETGLQDHTCARCEFTEEIEIPITHDFENDWTIDKAASPEEDGIMSRHCQKCDAVTDIITFSYEEIEDDNNNNDSSDSNSSQNNSSNSSLTDSSLNEASSEESVSNNSNDNNSSQDNKVNINNTVGEKVPLQQVEKLEGYGQITKPSLDDSTSSTPITSSQDSSSENVSNSSDLTTGVIIENNSSVSQNSEPSLLSIPAGVTIAIICSIFCLGIIVLCVLLIKKNKKQ